MATSPETMIAASRIATRPVLCSSTPEAGRPPVQTAEGGHSGLIEGGRLVIFLFLSALFRRGRDRAELSGLSRKLD